MGLPTGVTRIFLGDEALEVFCDQDTEGGGWLAFLRRKEQEEQLDFQRNEDSYIQGFGDPTGEHWLGEKSRRIEKF